MLRNTTSDSLWIKVWFEFQTRRVIWCVLLANGFPTNFCNVPGRINLNYLIRHIPQSLHCLPGNNKGTEFYNTTPPFPQQAHASNTNTHSVGWKQKLAKKGNHLFRSSVSASVRQTSVLRSISISLLTLEPVGLACPQISVNVRKALELSKKC